MEEKLSRGRYPKKKRSSLEGIGMEHGRLPPQCIEIEENVLGALMLEKNALDEVIPILKAVFFYKESHQKIFKAIKSLFDADEPVDILTVVNKLKESGELELVGGAYTVTQLTNKVTSYAANVDYHTRIVQQKYIQREIISQCSNLIKDAYEDTEDVFDTLETAIDTLEGLDPSNTAGNALDAITVSQDAIDMFNDNTQREYFYKTGNKQLDALMGITHSKIALLGGANGDGKTRFTSYLLKCLFKIHGDKIAARHHTLEDSSTEMLMNYLASEVHMKTKDIQMKKFGPETKNKIIKSLEEFQKYDIEYVEQWDKIKNITKQFEYFCKKRPDKLNILVIDNVLSLKDREDFKGRENSMYDFICSEILACRQKTKGFIFVVHHYNDDQVHSDRIKTGYMPTEKHLKGTEAFRRISNYILLSNNPGRRKDLLMDYNEDMRRLLTRMFILEGVKIRNDNTDALKNIIHFFKTLDYNIFEEIHES